MNLHMLIVEDRPIILDQIELQIKNLISSKGEEVGIDQFRIDKADCISVAEQFLKTAASNETPYDILFLDLSLPIQPGAPNSVRGGLDLINRAHDLGAVREIIVVSGNFDLDSHVTESYKRGVTSFIRKPYSEIELQQQMIQVLTFVSHREQFLFKLRKLVDERIPVLSASVWKSTAYQFSTRVYSLIQTLLYESEEMRGELNRRFAVETVKEDSLLSYLGRINEAIVGASEDLKILQNGFKDGESAEEIVIERELQQLAIDLRPCVAVKPIQSTKGETRVLSFHDNVRTVLKEILVGGLSEAVNSTRTWRAEVEVEGDGGMAAVRIRDYYPPLDDRAATRINEGENIPPQTTGLREWGLSLAQHIALRGGGRLIVEPIAGPENAGNLITYRIPLA